MTRIAALNDWSLGSSEEEEVGPTREVLEAEAAKCYNDAVRYLAHGQLDQAQEQFLRVINNPYIEKVSDWELVLSVEFFQCEQFLW